MTVTSALTQEQLKSFLEYVGIGASHPLHNAQYMGDAARDLHLLSQLHIHTRCTIPFDNLSLHYSSTHDVTTNPHDTYQKIVGDARGRGGYCFELNVLYWHVLLALGFPVYICPSHMWRHEPGKEDYCGGWSHIVLIVTLSDGSRYDVDIGVAGEPLTFPLLLAHDKPENNLGTQSVRLWKDWIPGQAHRTPHTKHWIYQFRDKDSDEWRNYHTFSDAVEALEADVYNLSWFTSAHPSARQVSTPLVTKFLGRPAGHDPHDALRAGDKEIYGKISLYNGVVKKRLGGETEIVRVCETEAERVSALSELFGLTLTDHEKNGVKGWVSDLDIPSAKKAMGEIWRVKRAKTGWERIWLGPAVPDDAAVARETGHGHNTS